MAIDPEAREREALAEMASTSVARPTARALVAAGLALLAVGIVPELAALARGGSRLVEPLPAFEVAPGPFPRARRAALAAREIERRFDERSALARSGSSTSGRWPKPSRRTSFALGSTFASATEVRSIGAILSSVP